MTGTCTPTTGGSWHLTASGPGLTHLHATWAGAPGSGHETLQGVFDGTLSGNTYSGNFTITEGSVTVTGTMSFEIVSATTVVVTLRATGSSNTQTIPMHCMGAHAFTPVKIGINFFASNQITAAPAGPRGLPSTVRCPQPRQPAKASGHIEAQITPSGDFVGSGVVTDDPFSPRCHSPGIKFAVDRIAITVTTPEHVIHATLYVHIDAEGTHQAGQCRVGTPGVIQATYDDTKVASNGLNESDVLRIGPWSGTGCNADNHVISDNASKIPAFAKGSTWVRATIACLGPPGQGYSPRNCGA